MKAMKYSVGHCSKVGLLSLLAIWTHISYAAPNGNISPHSRDQSSTGRSSSIFDASFNPSFGSGISNSDSKLVHPATQTYARRIARDTLNVKQGMTDISRFFPSNVDHKLQKWIELFNSQPKISDRMTDDYEECGYDDEGCEDDDQPVIDLVNGKKPRHMDESTGLGRQGTAAVWAGEDPTVDDPIVLQRHHMNKKSRYYSISGLVPKVFHSRVQIDPRRSKPLYLFSRSSFPA